MSQHVQIARHGDASARRALAAATGAAPELLTYLSADADAGVRAAVAGNPATPPQAGLMLARDHDITVRATLAGRIAALAPRLDPAAADRLTRISSSTLTLLAADAAEEVRAALAAILASLPDAPRALVLKLARDAAESVAEPVIRLSPQLTEADLLALIAAPPAPFTRRAVARRPGIAEPVADAIAGSADTPAIAALLANPSAAIREATLDRLAAESAPHDGWQRALIARPRLPPATARRLTALVAGHLLAALARRIDLPEDVAETLAARITARLETDVEPARREAPLWLAARAGEREALRLALAQDSGASLARIDAVLALRSGRAIAALCHKAGWSPALAAATQACLGRLPPAEVIRPNAEGGWALSQDDLAWQEELLEGLPG
jgi:uncharacterized protein (DUF2336 family)